MLKRSSLFVVVVAAVALNASCGGESGAPESKPLGASASATVSTDEERPQPSPSGRLRRRRPRHPPPATTADTPAGVVRRRGADACQLQLSLYHKVAARTPVQPSQFLIHDSIKVGASPPRRCTSTYPQVHHGPPNSSTRQARQHGTTPSQGERGSSRRRVYHIRPNTRHRDHLLTLSTQKGSRFCATLQDLSAHRRPPPRRQDEIVTHKAVNPTN